jgi:putative inorganic carbon (HCO3(-)) transporter
MFIAMIGYLALVLIRPQDYPALVDSIGVPLLPIALIVAALFWLLSGRKRFDAPQYLLLLLFFIVLMLSNVANGWFGGALDQMSKFAPTVLAFVVLANAADSPRRVRIIMGMFTVCATVLALHGIEQSQLGVGWTGIGMSQETRIQYVGIFNDPNDLGLLFVMCLPMAVYLAMRGGLFGFAKLFWLAASGILLYGIYLTDSRGTLLATLVVLGIYVWWRRGVITAGVLGAIALVGLMALPSSRMQELDVSEASAAGRVDSWYEGMQMFRQNPVLGVGADMYTDINPLTAHNSFVLVLAETGIIGFALWIAFIGYCFRMMLVAIREPPEELLAGADLESAEDNADHGATPGPDPALVEAWYADRDTALTLLLSLCGFFTAAFFLSRSYLVILYLLAALVVAHYTGMRQRNPGLPAFNLQHDLIRWPVWAVGGAVGLYILVKVLLAMAL